MWSGQEPPLKVAEVGAKIARCSLDSEETAPLLVLLCSMVAWPHKAVGKRGKI